FLFCGQPNNSNTVIMCRKVFAREFIIGSCKSRLRYCRFQVQLSSVLRWGALHKVCDIKKPKILKATIRYICSTSKTRTCPRAHERSEERRVGKEGRTRWRQTKSET